MEKNGVSIIIREFNPQKDCSEVEQVERICEVGPKGKLSLFTNLLGDPISRIRHSPTYLMLVAEVEVDDGKTEIVGMIRGCIKTVTCGKKISRTNKDDNIIFNFLPVCTKLAYILGLRVSPSHRRMRIGLKLVCKIEEWFRENGAEYSYIATENDNTASLHLFTNKCDYSKFRTPSILVNPVFAHKIRVTTRVQIHKLTPSAAESLYRRRFSTTEFFPRDIDSVLNNNLNLGTFIAVSTGSWAGSDNFISVPPDSWAVLSVWNCMDVFKLEVRGASGLKKGLAKASRVMDRVVPWAGLPSVPDLFNPFGLLFLYGLGGEGPQAVKFIKALCKFAHNMGMDSGCRVIATEVSGSEPLRLGIPHWKKLSCAEDMWCIKRLVEDYSDGAVGDWTKSPPGLSIFVDPREI